jgi:L,D-peptidoglycan transpeptidase YkuD (ErfK/YbiS/YcfS/YnhG family)
LAIGTILWEAQAAVTSGDAWAVTQLEGPGWSGTNRLEVRGYRRFSSWASLLQIPRPVSIIVFGRREIEQFATPWQPQDLLIRMGNRAISITYQTSVRDRPLSLVRVNRAAGNPRRGWLTADGWTIPVALGRGGIKANKREGDGGTPRGVFHPRRLWWRADRHVRPRTHIPARAIRPEDAWCEDPADRHYNQSVRRAAGEPGDRLRREDHLYDFIVEIDHNTRPRIAGRGSAVFLHLARTNFSPTAGCVSMTHSALLRLLRRMGPRTRIVIG